MRALRRLECAVERDFRGDNVAGLLLDRTDVDVAARLTAPIADVVEERERTMVEVACLRRLAIHHRRAKPRERLGEKTTVAGCLRRGYRVASRILGVAPLAEHALILRDHVEQRCLFVAVAELTRRLDELTAHGDRLLGRLALKCASALSHTAKSEDGARLRTTIEASERA